jgi:acylphosphatase
MGYVKNMPDGSVFVEAEGPKEKLSELLEYSKKGPKNAKVDHVNHEYLPPTHEFKGFDYVF